MDKNITLGVLGGLGPMSGILFCEMLIRHTAAERDQDHLNFILASQADTPDRTAFIMGESKSDPTPAMIDAVRKLSLAGADMIAIPCNTAHIFYESVKRASDIPVLNIIRLTAEFCRQTGNKRVGVLATEGTVKSGAYSTALSEVGIEYIPCTDEEQRVVNSIIYDNVKKGRMPDLAEFNGITEKMKERGCERLVLGCTELSVFRNDAGLGDDFADSLEILAYSAIRLCGKTPVGFSPELMNFDIRKEEIYVTE